MTKSVYLIGPPGVGKSTLMERLLSGYERLHPMKHVGPPRTTALVYEPLIGPGDQEPTGVSLGYRRQSFSGTDALGMSVNPQAIAWVESGAARAWAEVWGEGARLANKAFLRALDRHTELTVIELVAPWAELTARCRERGSDQADSWRRGAGTRAAKLASQLMMDGVRVHTVDADRPVFDVEADVRWLLRGGQ